MDLKVVIYKLYNIDTNNQSFQVKMHLHLINTSIHPTIEFTNDVQILHESHNNCQYDLICQGTFLNHMDLHKFPFDNQILHIQFEIVNVQEQVRLTHGAILEFHQSDDWHLYEQMYLDHVRNKITILIHVKRYGGYVMFNVMFPVFSCVFLSFVTFIIEANDFATRFNITFTLILTFIASKFSSSNMVPTTNYLTHLDKYMILSFAFLITVAIQNTVYYSLLSHGIDMANRFNRITGSSILSMWCLVHLVIGSYLYHRFHTDKKPKLSLPWVSIRTI